MGRHEKFVVALRKESVDRNSVAFVFGFGAKLVSLSARRAWIEIIWRQTVPAATPVALRKESVDRNSEDDGILSVGAVALRKESVDRNEGGGFGCTASAGVALRKESVDRNVFLGVERRRRVQSLSARRAWIEMCRRCCYPTAG